MLEQQHQKVRIRDTGINKDHVAASIDDVHQAFADVKYFIDVNNLFVF